MSIFCQYNNRIVTNNFEPVYICKIIFLKVLFLKWDCWVKKTHTLHWHPAKLPSRRVCPNPQLSNRAHEDSFQTLVMSIITFFFFLLSLSYFINKESETICKNTKVIELLSFLL